MERALTFTDTGIALKISTNVLIGAKWEPYTLVFSTVVLYCWIMLVPFYTCCATVMFFPFMLLTLLHFQGEILHFLFTTTLV